MTRDRAATPILAVDDDEDFLFLLERALGDAGFEVFAASTPAEARRQLRSRRFAVVMTDLVMPDCSGLEILAEARRVEPLTVGVVLTGHGSVDTALEAMREGAFDYVLKPCPPDMIAAAARRAVEHHALRAALLQKTAQVEHLQKQIDAKARLIQNVSHELKNPLSVVYGYSAFLLKQRQECQPEEVDRSLRSIHANAERLGALLEELLESTRLAGGKLDVQRARLAAGNLIEDVVGAFAPEAQRRGVALSGETREIGLAVHADARRVHQVLSNLVSNALKFTPAGGSVTVSVETGGSDAVFRVADTGVGIAEEDQHHLFERFYQAEATRRDHPGLGLGLSICKGLVELHGGRIWAESKPGRGSTFSFTVPLFAEKTVR